MHKIQTNFALIISRIFHYIFVSPFVFGYLFWRFPIEGNLKYIYPSGIFIFFFVLPVVSMIYLLKTGKVSDFEVSRRSQRHWLNLIGGLALGGLALVSYSLDIPEIYKEVTLYFVVYALVFGIITLFWKISYHLGVLGMVFAIFTYIEGVSVFWIILGSIVPILVGWSRVYLKKHSWPQVIVGYLLSVILFEILCKIGFI